MSLVTVVFVVAAAAVVVVVVVVVVLELFLRNFLPLGGPGGALGMPNGLIFHPWAVLGGLWSTHGPPRTLLVSFGSPFLESGVAFWSLFGSFWCHFGVQF